MKYLDSLNLKCSRENFNKPTLYLNSIGDSILTPVRYMLGGRKGTCVIINKDECFVNISQIEKSWFKTALSIALFVPSLILGSVFKGSAVCFSKNLRNSHQLFDVTRGAFDIFNDEIKVGLTNKKESCLERAKSCFQALEYKQQCRVWSRKKELLKTDYNMTDDNLTTLYDFLTNEKEVSIDKVTNMLRGNLSEDSWTS